MSILTSHDTAHLPGARGNLHPLGRNMLLQLVVRETLSTSLAPVILGMLHRQMTAENEIALVLHAAAGDREAFEVLAERCRPWLFGVCFRLLRDASTAEDLVQETLLRAFRDLGQLRDPSRFRPWLSRIAVNACRMHLRRLAVTASEHPLDEQSVAGVQAPDAPLGIDEALARLGAATRRMLRLFYVEERSHAEIAEALALSPAAVKSRLHRAREKLRKEMLAMMSDDQKARLGVTEEAPWSLRTILLVEPDEQVRESLRAALTAAGFEVMPLPTGEAALTAIAERRGQLLLLDKHCGEPNWIEVLTLVQAEAWSRENVPVGVFVDPDNQRDVVLAWQAGASICLTRPFRTEEAVKFVEHVARRWPDKINPGSSEPCGG